MSAARFEPHTRKRRRGKPVAVIAVNCAEPGVSTHPIFSGGDDVFVVAAHEVPPHDDVFFERLTADDQEAGGIFCREPQVAPP